MDMPAISGLSSDGRLVAFINKRLVHVPIGGVITSENLAELGLIESAVGKLDGVTANATFSVPAGWAIDNIFFANTTANAVSVKIGTTSGASDVMVIDVGANALADSFQSLDWILKKRLFSVDTDQTLYLQSTAWNSASLNIRVKRSKIF